MRTDRLEITVQLELVGRLYAERFKCITIILRDRLFIWSRTATVHLNGRDAIDRQEAGIGVEAQRKKEHDERASQDRK